MTSHPVTVVARMKARQGKEQEVKELLVGLLEPTRREDGCLNYDLHVSPEEPGLFLFHENWVRREDLDRHLATPHLQAFLARAGELLEGTPEITLWTRVG